mmetsp:Transcript_18101/g.38955  ORF Transcript_18101/g.38955 Transcript_18101/m.38955 type:complete len:139 (+) Transcript_18101:362-778(+)
MLTFILEGAAQPGDTTQVNGKANCTLEIGQWSYPCSRWADRPCKIVAGTFMWLVDEDRRSKDQTPREANSDANVHRAAMQVHKRVYQGADQLLQGQQEVVRSWALAYHADSADCVRRLLQVQVLSAAVAWPGRGCSLC